MMFSRAASTTLRRSGQLLRPRLNVVAKRQMGGGGHWMEVSKTHTWWGEVFGVICWVWVFHRARHDLPVVLGWKHPWDHDHDDIFTEHVHLNTKALEKDWDESWADPGDVDDEEEDEDDEDEDDDEDDE